MISAVILIMHGSFAESYHWLEKRKTWDVDNGLIVGAAFVLAMLFSAFFVRTRGDFIIFYLISIAVVVVLAVLQYKKAIKELISKK